MVTQARKEYLRRYREKNREKKRAYMKQWREENREHCNYYWRTWYHENRASDEQPQLARGPGE